MEFRNSRHTNDLQAMTMFYTGILGFQILFSFKDHHGYDGIMVGKPGFNWHLEFTTSAARADHKFDNEDMLVFYPDKNDYQEIIYKIKSNKIQIIKADNPYWNQNGIMIKDPDGFRIVISNQKLK